MPVETPKHCNKYFVFYCFCYTLLCCRQDVHCCILLATKYIARTTGPYLKLMEMCRKSTARTCVFWPSYFLTTRHSIMTLSHSSSMFLQSLMMMGVTSLAISPRFAIHSVSANVLLIKIFND